MSSPNIAFVHDWLEYPTGAEKVLEAALDLFPDAPVFTLVYNRQAFRDSVISRHRVYTSFLERLPGGPKAYRRYLPLMPLAIEQFDLRQFDLVVSSSHAVAKGVLTSARQLHVSYIHTPMRYAWDLYCEYLGGKTLAHGLRSVAARTILHYLRNWDVASGMRPDVLIANSHTVARRVSKTYRREARVLYPPVDVNELDWRRPRAKFFLVVARAVPYKRLDIVIDACNLVRAPLVVIGAGPDLDRLRQRAGPTTTLLGWQPTEVVRDHMERCRAYLFAGEEDFGIAPVEAQAAGAPVIAFRRGGVAETIVDGVTGVLFSSQTVEGMVSGLESFQRVESGLSRELIRANAERFSKRMFQDSLRELLDVEWSRFDGGVSGELEHPGHATVSRAGGGECVGVG